MPTEFGRLRVERVIVRDVPSRPVGGDQSSPELSDIDSPLHQELKNFFKERIAGSLAGRGYGVCIADETDSPVPGLVLELLASEGDGFVDASQQMATHLHDCQTGVQKRSLLAVILCSRAAEPAIAILKVEREHGAQIRQETVKGVAFGILTRLPDTGCTSCELALAGGAPSRLPTSSAGGGSTRAGLCGDSSADAPRGGRSVRYSRARGRRPGLRKPVARSDHGPCISATLVLTGQPLSACVGHS